MASGPGIVHLSERRQAPHASRQVPSAEFYSASDADLFHLPLDKPSFRASPIHTALDSPFEELRYLFRGVRDATWPVEAERRLAEFQMMGITSHRLFPDSAAPHRVPS